MENVIVEAYGIKYVVDAPSAGILNASYEPYITHTVKLPRDGVFVDVGAHVGKYAFYAAKQVEDGLVIAIEPLPQNMINLKAGIKLNNFRNIRTFQVACGAEEKHIPLFPTDGTTSWKTSHGTGFIIGALMPNTIQVPTRKLDNIIKEVQVKKIDMIKIDVEQYEYAVLKGSIETLTHYNPILQIEVWDINSQKQKVLDFLANLNYKISEILYSYMGDAHPHYQDILFKKNFVTKRF
jgi:FkbM family methyltransferase